MEGKIKNLATNNFHEIRGKFLGPGDGFLVFGYQIFNFAGGHKTFWIISYFQIYEHIRHTQPTHLITGMICGYRIEEIENPLTQKVRYLDKLVDELAKGRTMEKILR